MAVEVLLVFALKAPPSGASLQEALDREPIPVVISEPATLDLRKHTGFLPVKYKSLDTGFSIYQSTAKELQSTYPETNSLPKPKAVVSFEFGGNPLECVAVMRTASVLVATFGAKAFDPQSKQFVSADNLKTIAVICEDQVPSPAATTVTPARPGQ